MKNETESCSYGFYSKLLKKPFDTVDELTKAEDEYNKAHALEIQKAEEKKSRAEEIKDAYAEFLKVREEAKKEVEAVETKANERVRAAKQNYLKLRDKFVDDYGGYHMTYTNSDGEESFDIGWPSLSDFWRIWF